MEQTEIYAVYEGLKIAWNQGHWHIMVESDSKAVVKLIHEGFKKLSHNALIRGIVELCQRNWTVSITSVYREANILADQMVKLARRGMFSTQIFVHILPEVAHTVSEDKFGKERPRLVLAANHVIGS